MLTDAQIDSLTNYHFGDSINGALLAAYREYARLVLYADNLSASFAHLKSPLCWCEKCDTEANNGLRSRMSLCPSCGDKRCERSKDHNNICNKVNHDNQSS